MTATYDRFDSKPSALKREVGLLVGLPTLLFFLLLGKDWLSSLSGWTLPLFFFVWLFVAMLWLSFGVVHHADCLAVKLGEPYGTLILTLSVISIEVVMISMVMLTGADNPTLGRDMMFAVLMIVLNGLVGLSLLVGARRHREQVHNLQGANTFLIVLITLAMFTLILPNFTQSTEAGTYSKGQMVFAIAVSVCLYGAFLVAQTLRYRGYFKAPGANEEDHYDHGDLVIRSIGYHVTLLVANMVPIVLLSKGMAKVIDYQIASLNAPAAIGGVFIAILVLSPEGFAAVKAAWANHLQRSINICLGSALATIGMTVPAILAIGLMTGNKVVLGLDPVESILLATTSLIAVVTFSSDKTTSIHGLVHFILFIAYFYMIFD